MTPRPRSRSAFAALLPASRACLLALALLACRAGAQDGVQRFAELGDCVLESGAVIRDCRLGYRTWGRPGAAPGDTVLFLTWFGGTSAGIAGLLGPDGVLDPAGRYVIAVDALGNGVSSSPSNSRSQPGLAFPSFTIRDLVAAQRRLLDVLGISHLRGVVGMSMGGMQAFQWTVSYPDFADRAASIVGTPRQSARDLLLWRAELTAIRSDAAYAHGAYTGRPALAAANDIQALHLRTPEYDATHTDPAQLPALADEIERKNDADPNDRVRQLEAMLSHDVSAPYGGSLEAAASHVRAKLLVVVNRQDQMVNPLPSLAFAPLVGARTLVLDDECGHLALDCPGERARVREAMTELLAGDAPPAGAQADAKRRR